MFGVMLMVYRIAPQRQPPVSFSGRSEVAMMILLYAIDFERVRVEYQAIYIYPLERIDGVIIPRYYAPPSTCRAEGVPRRVYASHSITQLQHPLSGYR